MAAPLTLKNFADQLPQLLEDDLANAGVRAKVEVEKVPKTRLHRVFVVSKHRDRLRPSEWDALVWRILRNHFGPDADLRVSSIFTVTPQELRNYRAHA
jgi:hypothetical protein